MTTKAYKILNCNDDGISVVTGEQQYSDKTSTTYSDRTYEHFTKIKTGTIFTHEQKCDKCVNVCNCSMSMVEYCRGESTVYRRGNTCGTVEFRVHLTFKKF